MYRKHFGFSRKPFNITPNPEFIFLSETHREAFAHLLYGIQNHAGFIVLTGEVGTGKTTVLRTLLNQLDEETNKVALIFNPALSARELVRNILREYGLEPAGGSLDDLHQQLNQYLLAQNRAGKTVVLIIDEAQNLAPEVLEQVRLLSNLETETDKLIQIILVGQPELDAILAQEALRQLRQRVTVRYSLTCMSSEDSRRYIDHRIAVAGGREKIFSEAALKTILKRGAGIPRMLNVLCDRALLAAYADNAPKVEEIHVRQVEKELLRIGKGRKSLRRALHVVGTIVLVTLLLVGFGVFRNITGQLLQHLPSLEKLAKTGYAPEAPAASSPSTAAEPPSKAGTDRYTYLSTLRHQLSRKQETLSPGKVAKPLLHLWQAEVEPPAEASLRRLRQICETAGLNLASFSGNIGQLLAFDRPMLLEIVIPGDPSPRYLAVVGREKEGYRIWPDIAGRQHLSIDDIRGLWSGRAYLFWRDFDRIGSLGHSTNQGEAVMRLQKLLGAVGLWNGTPSDVYDESTLEAVTRFQAQEGLIQDGRVGPQTLMLLYLRAGYPVVRLSAANRKGQAS